MAYGKRPIPPTASQQTNMSVGHNFGQALAWLKNGRKVTRTGWSGQGMFVYMVRERTIVIGDNDEVRSLEGLYAAGQEIEQVARLDMRYPDGRFGVWTITQADVMADDWALLL